MNGSVVSGGGELPLSRPRARRLRQRLRLLRARSHQHLRPRRPREIRSRRARLVAAPLRLRGPFSTSPDKQNGLSAHPVLRDQRFSDCRARLGAPGADVTQPPSADADALGDHGEGFATHDYDGQLEFLVRTLIESRVDFSDVRDQPASRRWASFPADHGRPRGEAEGRRALFRWRRWRPARRRSDPVPG